MSKWLVVYVDPSKLGMIPQTRTFSTSLAASDFINENMYHSLGIYETTGRQLVKTYEWKVVDIG